MVAVSVLVFAWGLLAVLMARPWRHIGDEQTLAGLFGSGEREALIARWTEGVVAVAERYERLDAFRRYLEQRAWDGMPLRIEKAPRGWYRWQFSDGDTWHVRHVDRPPRATARLVVGSSPDEDEVGLSVRAYIPGSHDVRLPIDDARHPLTP